MLIMMSPAIIMAIETVTIAVAGTLTGNEPAMAVFFHPRISRLEDAAHVRAGAIPGVRPWQGDTILLCAHLFLSLVATFVAHPVWSTAWWLALCSTALFAAMIIYSVLLPVPINNKVARWQPGSLPGNWRELRRRWDMLHAIRVVFLVVALILLVAASVVKISA
jgi:hypothetical protein